MNKINKKYAQRKIYKTNTTNKPKQKILNKQKQTKQTKQTKNKKNEIQ